MAATLDDVFKAITDQNADLRYWNPGVAMAAMVSFKASSATSIMLVNANPSRRGLIVVNTDANTLYLRYGSAATTGSGGWTYAIGSGVTWEMPQPPFGGRIDGIWTAAGAGVAEITEL